LGAISVSMIARACEMAAESADCDCGGVAEKSSEFMVAFPALQGSVPFSA
jgi:hypothetical protein